MVCRTHYGLQGHVYRIIRVARPMPRGRPLKEDGDIAPQINDKRPDNFGIQNPAYRPAAFFYHSKK